MELEVKHDYIHKLLSEIHAFTSTAGEALYEAGLRWGKLKQMKAHKLLGIPTWNEFVKSYTTYEVAYVDFCIAIAEKYGSVIESKSTISVPFSRLRDALPLISSPADAEHWYHQAETLPSSGWQDAIREGRGLLTSDNCCHDETELWTRCKQCKCWIKQSGG